MKIAVIGAGAVGGCYGAALAKSGEEVTFVARGTHLAAMQANGLRVEGARGETVIKGLSLDNRVRCQVALERRCSSIRRGSWQAGC